MTCVEKPTSNDEIHLGNEGFSGAEIYSGLAFIFVRD